jgi:hypothetical protein
VRIIKAMILKERRKVAQSKNPTLCPMARRMAVPRNAR